MNPVGESGKRTPKEQPFARQAEGKLSGFSTSGGWNSGEDPLWRGTDGERPPDNKEGNLSGSRDRAEPFGLLCLFCFKAHKRKEDDRIDG